MLATPNSPHPETTANPLHLGRRPEKPSGASGDTANWFPGPFAEAPNLLPLGSSAPRSPPVRKEVPATSPRCSAPPARRVRIHRRSVAARQSIARRAPRMSDPPKMPSKPGLRRSLVRSTTLPRASRRGCTPIRHLCFGASGSIRLGRRRFGSYHLSGIRPPGGARPAAGLHPQGSNTPGGSARQKSVLLIRFRFAAPRDEEIKYQSREQPNQHLSEDGVHLASPFIENF